jgi:hypothetical protein
MLGGYVAVYGASNAQHSLLMIGVTPPPRRELAPPPTEVDPEGETAGAAC